MRLVIIALVLLCISVCFGIKNDFVEGDYNLSIRELFHRNFHAKCSKYPFVQRYQRMLEDPAPRYVVFTYHKPYLRNGGFGDRMGGLVTAAAYALKYNRTLILQASNGMFDLFKPYHPLDIEEGFGEVEEPVYTWEDAGSWSKYTLRGYRHTALNIQAEATDSIYFNLDDCVSNTEEGFSTAQTLKCSMMAGDVPQPVVRFTSNRAYLCLWGSKVSKPYPAYAEMKWLGLGPKANLLEAAGCMLRLTMWPRDALWDAVDDAYRQLTGDIQKPKKKKAGKLLRKAKALVADSFTTAVPRAYQIGCHFRCGDVHSYRHLTLGSDGYDRRTCVFEEGKDEQVVDWEAIGKSRYMNAGHPQSIGKCAKEMVHGNTVDWKAMQSTEVVAGLDGSVATIGPKKRAPAQLVYITSDNVIAGEQTRNYTAHPWALVSPQGCHIELDHSAECFVLTTVYWFMLALSDKIVTQTFGTWSAPTSSFSRYAGMYGLYTDRPYHSGRHCELEETAMTKLSRVEQGNWICDLR